MRFTKKLAYQHLAQRKQEGEPDLLDKFGVIGILKECFGLYGLTGEVVQIEDDTCRLPDILIKAHVPPIVIELDGEVHGMGDDVSKRNKDILRDLDYKQAGCKLIIINKEATNGYDPHQVFQIIRDSGLKPLWQQTTI